MKKLAVYGKNKDGDMELIKRGLSTIEAIELADKHYRDTGRTAVIVKQDSKKEERK